MLALVSATNGGSGSSPTSTSSKPQTSTSIPQNPTSGGSAWKIVVGVVIPLAIAVIPMAIYVKRRQKIDDGVSHKGLPYRRTM